MSETDIEQEYQKAVYLLRNIKRFAKHLARSGNPGRRSAGEDILRYLEES